MFAQGRTVSGDLDVNDRSLWSPDFISKVPSMGHTVCLAIASPRPGLRDAGPESVTETCGFSPLGIAMPAGSWRRLSQLPAYAGERRGIAPEAVGLARRRYRGGVAR